MWEPRLSSVIAEYCFDFGAHRNDDFILAEAREMAQYKNTEEGPIDHGNNDLLM
jgi:hypothetical protein